MQTVLNSFSTCMLGALPAVGDMLLPHQLVQPKVLDREGSHITDGVDVWVAGLQLPIHLHTTTVSIMSGLHDSTEGGVNMANAAGTSCPAHRFSDGRQPHHRWCRCLGCWSAACRSLAHHASLYQERPTQQY